MTAALLWKEYRQQRTIWLAILFFAALLVVGIPALFGPEDNIRGSLVMVVVILTMAFGVISGGVMLAGENEEGTLVFLDSLTGRRGPMWETKLVAGVVLTLSLSVLMAAMGVVLGFGSWRTVFVVAAVGLDALAWGLLGGALCASVLKAVLVAIFFTGLSWFIAYLPITGLEPYPGKLVTGSAAAYLSWLLFCREDRTRLPASMTSTLSSATILRDVTVVLWLTLRQGRWLLVGGLVVAVALAFSLSYSPILLWPVGTMLFGLTCGLAAFSADQQGGSAFLAARRIPLGRIWLIKTVFWLISACALTALTWCIATVAVPTLAAANLNELSQVGSPRYWVGRWMRFQYDFSPSSLALMLCLWPLYGFCLGLLFGQAAKRPVVGTFMGFLVSSIVLGLLTPSVVIGQVHAWWLLVVPCLLVLTSRLAMRPWIADRLYAAKPMAKLIGAGVVMTLCLLGFLGHRAQQVPDVGEPFDVEEYKAKLDGAKKSQAGSLLRQALERYREQRLVASEKLGSRATSPDRKDYDDWLDVLFEGDWVKFAREGARAELGVVQSPALWNMPTRNTESEGFWINPANSKVVRHLGLGVAFVERAVQLQAKGDYPASLDHLETVLGIARQLKNYSPGTLFAGGCVLEQSALTGYQQWLSEVGPDKELLRAGLAMLQKHESAMPDPANSVKLDYVEFLENEGHYVPTRNAFRTVTSLSQIVPWEEERLTRIRQAICSGKLREIQKPYWQHLAWRNKAIQAYPNQPTRFLASNALGVGLPPDAGPGAEWDAAQWGEFIQPVVGYYTWSEVLFRQLSPNAQNQQLLRAKQLITALAMYQADHGKPPPKIQDVVPHYLSAVPINPMQGKPFGYQIAEAARPWSNYRDLTVGQAFLFCADDAELTKNLQVFPVPIWKK